MFLENKGYISFIGNIFYFKEWPFFNSVQNLSISVKVQVAEVRRRPENRKNHLFIQAQVSTNPRACGNLAIDLVSRMLGDCLPYIFFNHPLKPSMLGSNVKCILLTCYFMHLWVQATAALERILSCISRKNQLEKARPTYSIAAGVFKKNGQWPLFARVSHKVLLWHLYRRLAVSRSEAYNQYPQQTPHSCKQVARWGNMNVWFLCRTEGL